MLGIGSDTIGAVAITIKNSYGTTVKSNTSSILVTTGNVASITNSYFYFMSSDYPNGTYTLTMTVDMKRGSYTSNSTHTMTFIVDA